MAKAMEPSQIFKSLFLTLRSRTDVPAEPLIGLASYEVEVRYTDTCNF